MELPTFFYLFNFLPRSEAELNLIQKLIQLIQNWISLFQNELIA